MPSPFTGMDPFIECQLWDDFHPTLMGTLREVLTAQLRPRYIIRVERRVYVEHELDEALKVIRPDVAVLKRRTGARREQFAAAVTAVAPVVLALPKPKPERRRESFLTIRETESREVVTVIEVLSPGNKRRGSDGRREYLNKRETVLQSNAHLVELDLLRGGLRLPTVDPLPKGDYFGFVCRRQQRWQAEVYAWTLRDPIPPIPIPLAAGDRDAVLDLQGAFTTTYDRSGYDYSLDYQRSVEPALTRADATWVTRRLGA